MQRDGAEGAGVVATPESETAASGRERAQQSAAGTGAQSSGDTDQPGLGAGSTPFESSLDYARGWAGLDGGGGAEGAAPASAGLPCRNGNNSTESEGYKLHQVIVPSMMGDEIIGAAECLRDGSGRTWRKADDGWWEGLGITSAEQRSAFQLRQNVEAFVEYWGRERCAFMTLTKGGIGPRGFARLWNSFNAHHGEWIRAYIRIVEPHRSGDPHYHFLIATPWDMRPDSFDWRSFSEAQKAWLAGRMAVFRQARRLYVASAAPEVRAMWKRLRTVLPRYGLGRAEFLPVRKQGGIASYLGKYLSKGFGLRRDDWKGCRRVEYDRRQSKQWKRCSRVFSWVSPGAAAYRDRVRRLAGACGLHDYDELRRVFGPRWAYNLRGALVTGSEEEFRDAAALLVAQRIFNPRPCLQHGMEA